ncbi:MAG: addiction module antidote protein [Elusimicrobiota bacterium]|jgi:probable addiction module antidote protein
MKAQPPYVSHEDQQVREFRKHPKRAIAYLNSCVQVAFEENDPELVLIALATVAKAYGMTHVAKSASLKRESLHRMLSKRGNPEWNSLFRVFKALRLRPRLESTQLRPHLPS